MSHIERDLVKQVDDAIINDSLGIRIDLEIDGKSGYPCSKFAALAGKEIISKFLLFILTDFVLNPGRLNTNVVFFPS